MERVACTTRGGRGVRAVAMALLFLLGGGVGAASALSIDEISPVYFEGPGGWGFDAQRIAELGIEPSATASPNGWIDAGHRSLGLPLSIEQQLTKIHKKPKKPSQKKPVIADSLWTVTNDSGRRLDDAWLVFTIVDPDDSYPDRATALDVDLIEILAYEYAGEVYRFGAIWLGDLLPGESARLTVRYIVAGKLQKQDGEHVLPPLGVAGVLLAVPEPGTVLLLSTGLIGLAWKGRRREVRRWRPVARDADAR